VLTSGTLVRGFKPGRSRRIFKGRKILSTPSFGREVKPWVPCRRFAACTRSLNVPYSRPQVPTSAARVRNASVCAGASGGQSWNVQSGRYSKPAGCSTSVACRGCPWKRTKPHVLDKIHFLTILISYMIRHRAAILTDSFRSEATSVALAGMNKISTF
jgi:hypothetical protein